MLFYNKFPFCIYLYSTSPMMNLKKKKIPFDPGILIRERKRGEYYTTMADAHLMGEFVAQPWHVYIYRDMQMETTIRCTSYLLKSFEPKWNNKGGREGEKSRYFGVLHKATLLFVRLFTLVFFLAPQKGRGNNTG
jgi:hypothetical protein